ncbi:MAG: hypothetical protein KGM24_11110 [Elusimicrobia bacterium]|nr:hypothetical protein [Elusimicrobiota bacterium]
MTRAALALALAGSLAAGAAAAPAPKRKDPFDAEARSWAAKGYVLKDRVETRAGGSPAAVAVYASEKGAGDRLEAYVVVDGKTYIAYLHPAEAERLELDVTPAGRGFLDLLGDGSRVVAYHATVPALNATTLYVLRYRRPRFTLAGRFPEGRFVQIGRRVIVQSRDLPLGRFLTVGCAGFGTISQTAFRTRLYAPVDGRFVEVTRAYPKFFAAEILRKEAALARLRPDLQKNAGEYLGLALSVYYDYAAVGRAREGWEKQKEFFSLPPGAPRRVEACFAAMRRDLKERLRVPAR